MLPHETESHDKRSSIGPKSTALAVEPLLYSAHVEQKKKGCAIAQPPEFKEYFGRPPRSRTGHQRIMRHILYQTGARLRHRVRHLNA